MRFHRVLVSVCMCVCGKTAAHVKKSLREKEEVDLHEMTRKGEKKLDVGD